MIDDDCNSFAACAAGNMTVYNDCPEGSKFSDSQGKTCVPTTANYAGCFMAFEPDVNGCYTEKDAWVRDVQS